MKKTIVAFAPTCTYEREDIFVQILGTFTKEDSLRVQKALEEYNDNYGKTHDEDFCDFNDREAITEVLDNMGFAWTFLKANFTIEY